MKITRETEGFKPITIVIETQKEFDEVMGVLNHSIILEHSTVLNKVFDFGRDSFQSTVAHETWSKLDRELELFYRSE
jgi:hypothetical protein